MSTLKRILLIDDDEDDYRMLQRSGRRKIKGAGLGLSIVKEIAEKHGGHVWVRPGAVSGTVFYVSINKFLQ